MDKLFLRKIQLKTTVGCLPWEESRPQNIFLSLSLLIADLAAKSDNLNDTVDYAALVDDLVNYYAACRFKLLEALAENTAAYILANYPVEEVQLELIKPGILPAVAEVGIMLTRRRQD